MTRDNEMIELKSCPSPSGCFCDGTCKEPIGLERIKGEYKTYTRADRQAPQVDDVIAILKDGLTIYDAKHFETSIRKALFQLTRIKDHLSPKQDEWQPIHTPQERLNRLSKVNNKTGCVEWTGALRNGYGRLIIGSRTDGSRKSVSAHRMSYEINFGEVTEGLYVCHRCDNRKCINPEHLFLGTHQDNIDDRESKGRNNHFYKLTDADVSYIIDYPRRSGLRKHLAIKFNVSEHTIKDIRAGKARPTPPKTGDE